MSRVIAVLYFVSAILAIALAVRYPNSSYGLHALWFMLNGFIWTWIATKAQQEGR